MKKRLMELGMGIMLLAGIFLLSKEVVQVAGGGEGEKQVILVDPGHGGIDPGMVGIDNLREKDVNLEISLLLKECLEQKGYQVVMTREEDTGLYDSETSNKKVQDLQRRCDMIEEYQPVLTVSIHQNSYPDASVCGPQVFYYADSIEGEKLATAIQEQLNGQLQVERPRTARGNTSYFLLKRSKGVLNIVECGFLTNEKEARNLTDKNYQKKTAQAICDGICAYLNAASKTYLVQ